MIATPSPIPPPRPDDDEDVHWALSTASALWARGDAAESIKWLRRAAETASDQNRDQRSLELFKAAADATSLVRPAAPTAPLPAPPAPNPSSPPARPGVGPTGTIPMQIPPAANLPGATVTGQGSSPAPPAPAVRPSAPMPPPQGSPPGRAPVPQRPSAHPPGVGGPPAGTARAAAAQANAQAQVARAAAVRTSALPPAVSNARQVLKATLPSEGTAPSAPRVPAARPSPGAAPAPSSAAKRADTKKQPLDARFQFPDEEVTVQRDLAALKKPRPVHTELADDAVAAAATQRAPAVAVPVVARTLVSTTAGSAAVAAAAAAAGGATPRGMQPIGRAPGAEVAAPHAIANEPTAAEPDHEHTPLDDLDEQTSVLAGDEPELDFEGSATGETSAAMLASIEQHAIERSQLEADPRDDVDLDEGETGDESSDPRHGALSAPSVRPEPMPRAAAATHPRSATAWTAVRVAVRRDASGVRVDPLARGARPAPGAIAAVLVAQDDATAEALLKLLDG